MANSNFTFVMDEKDYRGMKLILEGFSKIDRSAAIQSALKRGGQSIMEKGKINLSIRNKKKTGNLSRSFGVRVNKKRAYAIIGHRRPAGAHSFLIDRGTAKRWTNKGAYRGSISKGNPNKGSMYWTDAVMQQGPKAQEGLMKSIQKSIEDIIDKNKN